MVKSSVLKTPRLGTLPFVSLGSQLIVLCISSSSAKTDIIFSPPGGSCLEDKYLNAVKHSDTA